MIDNLRGLAGVSEIHPRGASINDIERPDRIVFALDPGETVAWSAMFAAAQTSEHDDITCDGSLVAWAEQRGNEDAVKPLTETREVEKRTDKLLSEMAEQKINRQAAE